ncbi:MAG TPA: hydrogenase nickel incorporation protein HypB, partial [Rubrivivax sp.]|jgi:hydrogenase nickel incorporation protein HypB|nr:hydrogenase nickel incorporation protein HypB [Betaproteobacteria bacterium]MBK7514365.1 hydrogenase nickel incorporation protein HypB [Betaproteobacteria bacterium]MBK8863697.1 hydrogenase nickel incorporation protein HypB [Betaproteobacteria bacterium]MBL0295701.1 hydrogenase nickel incorporation protein HypB [Betaproteobacteria bacterium]HRC39433.1 hydrogenase nickel incorporation protein HypB [Rubrivivax sp.]
MCVTCGCGSDQNHVEGEGHGHEHTHADGTTHAHPHVHGQEHGHAHEHDHAHGRAHEHAHGAVHRHRHADGSWHSHDHGDAAVAAASGAALGAAHAPGVTPKRMVQIEQDILAKNDAVAAANRQRLADRGIFALNLVSSPGSGKTTLLVKTIQALQGRLKVAVIEGDQQTTLDADRIRATGAPAVQVNTGKGCHLDADMVRRALDRLDPADGSLLLIENVGNLVCPAAFDLGEAHKVVILSVTEGEDKPLKYPDMFHAADLLLVNKTDLLPYVQFDVEAAIGHARRVRPGIEALRVSATTGEGMDAWLDWLERGAAAARAARDASVEALRRRVAELEARLGAAD